jgi:hypothetical protein
MGNITSEFNTLKHFIEEFNDWGKISGAALNMEKTQIFAINKTNIIERIKIVNIFALSKLWYVCNLCILDEKRIKEIEKKIFDFIWKNKRELIKREIFHSNYESGCLQLVNIRTKLKTIVLRNFFYIKKLKDIPHYQFAVKWLKNILRKELVNFNIILGGLDNEKPLKVIFQVRIFIKP